MTAKKQAYLVDLHHLAVWEQARRKRIPLGFDLELTARCNLNCRHCYLNLPPTDHRAAARELKAGEIIAIAEQAVALGALWCGITGGEPLLRPDFSDLYLALKKLGLLLTIHTNATLVSRRHVELFRHYPPRDIEVTVYGATAGTYERVTRVPGSFQRFRRGLQRLIDGGIKVRLKSMALRSNLDEMGKIAEFCRLHTKDYFRFDPLLHLRTDRDPARNSNIRSERLTPEEIMRLERSDSERFASLLDSCDRFIEPARSDLSYDECAGCERRGSCEHFDRITRLIACGAGRGGFHVAYDGTFRLCASLCAPGMTYDLRSGSLKEAWTRFAPAVRSLRIEGGDLLKKCRFCPIVNLCMNCPAHADLETGDMLQPVDYFCQVAQARRQSLEAANPGPAPVTRR